MATRGDASERLDLLLRRRLADVRTATRSRIQRWIQEGAVRVDGRVVRRPASRVAHGHTITVSVPDAPPRRTMAAEDRRLDILFEDDFLLALSKPAGLVVHPTYGHAEGTLMNALLWHARTWPAPRRPSLVGRLDKLTSGIVLVAKTRAIHASLQRTLASGASRKEYLALVYGRVAAARGLIDLKLERDGHDRRRVVASTQSGAPSSTRFERLARTSAAPVGLALLRCRLLTGRMHQIRAHLAARGWPIVGDPVYGAPHWQDVTDPVLAAALETFGRQALHAWRLTFPHPVTGAAVEIQSAVPDDLARLLDVSGLSRPDASLHDLGSVFSTRSAERIP